jgi:Zn finger protein HypA/HybF involved in hydrogenase expression
MNDSSKIRLQKIIKLKNENKTIPEISKLLNICKGTIGYYLKLARENNIEYLKMSPNKVNTIEKLENYRIKKRETRNKKILKEDFKDLSFDRCRIRVILEQEEKCNRCGNFKWFDKKLSLELEHKDGDNQNNNRENLEALCPNCHSITLTWRGRNKRNKRLKISDEVFMESLIKNQFNIRQSLLSIGLTPKGGNYKRAYMLIDIIKKI